MVAVDEVNGDTRLVQTLHARDEKREVRIRRARIVEHVAGYHHEIDLMLDGNVDDAIERSGNGSKHGVGPLRRHRPQPFERGAKMQVRCMYEGYAAHGTPLRIARISSRNRRSDW